MRNYRRTKRDALLAALYGLRLFRQQHFLSVKKENEMIRNFLIIILAVFVTTSIVGCNMFKGAGKDVENAGESIQKTVDKNN